MAESKPRRLKGDGIIKQRSDGSWEGGVPIGKNPVTGRTSYKTVYGKSRQEVRNKMRAIVENKTEIITPNGTYILVEKPEIPPVPYGEWLDTWLKTYKVGRLTPSTYESYRVIIEHHLKPTLGKILITDITTDQIQKVLNAKQEIGARKDGRNNIPLAASSVMKIKILINASLKQAVKNRMIPYNPAEAVTPPKMTRREIRVLTPDEQSSFMNILQGHRLEALFKLVLATGMRKGELLALTWDCVDFDNKTISISKSAVRVRNQKTMKTEIKVGSPKSESGYREIPMLPSMVSILEKHYAQQENEKKAAGSAYNRSDLVFCSKVGTYIEPSRINTTLKKLLNYARMDHINFHALRHTFATRALENGVSAKVVQKILGHTDVALTLNTYTHVLKETLHDQIQKMDDIFTCTAVKESTKKRTNLEPERVR